MFQLLLLQQPIHSEMCCGGCHRTVNNTFACSLLALKWRSRCPCRCQTTRALLVMTILLTLPQSAAQYMVTVTCEVTATLASLRQRTAAWQNLLRRLFLLFQVHPHPRLQPARRLNLSHRHRRGQHQPNTLIGSLAQIAAQLAYLARG